MLKKGLLVGAGVVLVLGLLFGRNGISYMQSTVSDIRAAANDSIPTETKIRVAKAEIDKLDPVIKNLAYEIAREEIKIKNMVEELGAKKAKLEKDQEHVNALTNHLRDGGSFYVVKTKAGTKSYSQDVVESDLRSCFENYKTNKSTIEKLSQIIDARRQGLEAARQSYEDTKIARHELEVQVENLGARLKMVEVAKSTSEFSNDDSQLSYTRELIEDIQGRVETEELLTQLEPTETRIPRADDVESNENILEEVTSYFGVEEHFVAEK